MNKKLLSLAVAAGLASSSAQAVDLNAGTGSNTYASEITIGASAILAPVAANSITVNTGFSISDSTARYMRFDFTNAAFTDATGLALAVDDAGGTGGANEVLSTGGAATNNFVVYEVTASTGDTVGVTNDAVLSLPNLTVTSAAAIGVTYRLYDNAVDAVNNTAASALVTSSGTVASSAAGNTVANTTAGAVTPSLIDVTTNTTNFVVNAPMTATRNTIGDITVADTAAGQFAIDGTTDVTTAVIQSASTLTITGDFTATQDLTSGVPDGTYTPGTAVYLDRNAGDCATISVAATTVTDTEAVIAMGQLIGQSQICIVVNGVSPISEGTYTAVYAPTLNAGYTDAATSLTLGTLGKNGSTVVLNLALTPGGSYANFIRINNTSNITGDVFITVINDDGDQVQIDLADIAGQSTSSLVGQASTGLLPIQSIFDAAQAADATFALGATNKLRLSINGEFSSIDAQSVTLSQDSNSFTTF